MPAMAFGRKRSKDAPSQSVPWQTSPGAGGYVVSELPYYEKGKRKVVVYTSDSTGKIIKTFKK